jgi:hypothetical protein
MGFKKYKIIILDEFDLYKEVLLNTDDASVPR